MDRRRCLRVLGGAAIAPAVAGCSADLPAEAVQAWQGPAASEADLRRWALAYAILAPHSHNLQSWVVDLRQPGEITLLCDPQRLLPETDPFSRQIMMSHGTFLELLDIAARERGHRPEVELFPQGAYASNKVDARPVARVRLVPDASVRRDPLFAQVMRRRTNREAYEPREPAPAALQAIAAAAQAPGLRTGFTTNADNASMGRQRAIAAEAWRIELTTPRTIMESYRLLRVGPGEIARHRDGLTINSPMLRAMDMLGLFDRSKAPGPDDYATKSQLQQFNEKLAATPAFFWMASEGNDRATQVNAGRAYVRAQLAATAHGLAMQPLSQALQEYPEQAKPYAQVHELFGAKPPQQVVQMWARLGHGPAIGPSPRRALSSRA
ncbi:MAG: twin-arginine translocation pathway signal protein [Burkholderiales bacterium]|nr:twin-arginine translocation pathway signal protein [Burkholderiales bacterium]